MKLIYYCDRNRHLICYPYSIQNLHTMAMELGIGGSWFHSKGWRSHYDIPKSRIEQVTSLCVVVTTRELLMILKVAKEKAELKFSKKPGE